MLEQVWAGYQPGVDILQGVSIATSDRPLTLVIGPNGAGKSTALKTAFGFLHPHRGTVSLDGRAIDHLAPHEIKSLGIAYIPQGINVFPQLSIIDNLKMGAWTFRHDRSRIKQQLSRIYELFPVLYERRSVKAHELSGGQAKMLSIAKEVMADPRVVLVDEPTAGLAPALASQVYDFLLAMQELVGAPVLLVDQNIEGSVQIADYIYVIELGKVKTEGPVSEFQGERVRQLVEESLRG
ncbi:MAG: ABC transporter ATP-binding protein [Nocardioidaceae bacterium]